LSSRCQDDCRCTDRVKNAYDYELLTHRIPLELLQNYPIHSLAERRAVRYWSIILPTVDQRIENDKILKEYPKECLAVKTFLYSKHVEISREEVKANNERRQKMLIYKILRAFEPWDHMFQGTPQKRKMMRFVMATTLIAMIFFISKNVR
jgi:hypothetical protein